MDTSDFSGDFKRAVAAQITGLGSPVAVVSKRPGVSAHSPNAWKKKFFDPNMRAIKLCYRKFDRARSC
ncbi:hypothetical protein [uncultured Roseibium sp.]|uniref:hypothetical protein n=1 Tax=uncultured Roseibium sp. TaxID=1936171 RepID=UPI00261FF428|nr:hypothetical protein [uncultured Roseibium sp.]